MSLDVNQGISRIGSIGPLLAIVLGLDMLAHPIKEEVQGRSGMPVQKEDPAGGLFAALTEGLTPDQIVIVRRLMAAHVTFLVETIRLADEQRSQG